LRIDRADVGIVQARRSLSHSPETVVALRIVGNLNGLEFQRHETTKPNGLGLVHHFRSPIPELLNDTVG
jgi:hypothetical protein